jgi:hypothetical protein
MKQDDQMGTPATRIEASQEADATMLRGTEGKIHMLKAVKESAYRTGRFFYKSAGKGYRGGFCRSIAIAIARR